MIRFIAASLLACGLVAPLAAQEPAAPPAPVVDDPLARDLLATNPSTPAEMLRVLDVLVNLKQAKAGTGLLAKLAGANLNDEQMAALVREFGSGKFLKLSLVPELQPQGKQWADSVLAGANRRARDPEQIAALIGKLSAGDIEDRSATIAELELGGEVAVAAMITALGQAQTPEEQSPLKSALAAMRDASVDAVAVMLNDDRPESVAAAADILARMGDAPAHLYLLRPAYSPKSTPEVRAVAVRGLTDEAGKIPSETDAAARLYNAARKYDQQPPVIAGDATGKALLWSWNLQAHQPQVEAVTQRLAALELAARFAAAGREILPTDANMRRLAQTLQLEAAIERAGGIAKLDRGPNSLFARVAEEGVASVEDLLVSAAADGHTRAAIVATEILTQRGTTQVLVTRGGKPSPLAKAAAHPDRRLRFAAVRAILEIDPISAYPGSSFVTDALRYFVASHGQRVAVVADVRPFAAQQVAGMLSSLGYRTSTATNEREVFKAAISNPDLELIIIDQWIAKFSSGKVVQNLRDDCRTANIPIGLMAATYELEGAEVIARSEPFTTAFLRPLDPVNTERVVRETLAVNAPSVPVEERLEQARAAMGWIVKLHQHKRDGLYPLIEMEAEVVRALDVPALRDAAIVALADLGTPASQRALVELISDSSAPITNRQAAAGAFGANVVRHGTLLTLAEISLQYDRYNASESQDKQVQAVLASILDAIEAHAADQNVGIVAGQPR